MNWIDFKSHIHNQLKKLMVKEFNTKDFNDIISAANRIPRIMMQPLFGSATYILATLWNKQTKDLPHWFIIFSNNIKYDRLPERRQRLQILYVIQLAKQLPQQCLPEIHYLLTGGNCCKIGGSGSRIGRQLFLWHYNYLWWWAIVTHHFIADEFRCTV